MLNFLEKIGSRGKIGYEAFFIIGAIAFVVIFFWPPLKYSPIKQGSGGSLCVYNPPLTSETYVEDGVNYDLLKKQAPIIGVQASLHTHRARTLVIKGKERKVSQPEGDSGVSNWFTGDGATDPLWHNLRFVDVTDEMLSKPPGTKFFDIYIKRNATIPPGIISYCAGNTVEFKGYLADNFDKSFPPKEIDAATFPEWQCGSCLAQFFASAPRDGKYYLYAYDVDTAEPIRYVKRTGHMPSTSITIDNKSYTVVYYGGWESKHLRLETTDPLSGKNIGYRYANPERLTIPEDPYKFLNTGSQTATASLQLQAFSPFQIAPAGWWTPECKPAIYLYPKNKMNVNVKVAPKGTFTYTDPVYDSKKGWNVTAYPDGKLSWQDNAYGVNSKGEKRQTNIYDYLYYESKIHDSLINKPNEGYVIANNDLYNFYQTTLPKLGLNQKETQDYIEYWTGILPEAEYYFIGLLSKENVDFIEPMSITPQADSTLRVRLYYEALNKTEAEQKMKTLKNPVLSGTFERNGFTVVEWGGMVKQDKDHPFTCSI